MKHATGTYLWIIGKCLLFHRYMLFLNIFLRSTKILFAEAATGVVLLEKVFLKISQNPQENTCVRVSFLIKLYASGLQVY